MSKIRVGVVGLGMGLNHVHAFHADELCELTYVIDVNEAKAMEIAEKFGCSYATDMKDALGGVDALAICTPHHLHGPQTLLAIHAGKHVLLEKPLANTEEECIQITNAADENDVTLMLAYVVRFMPAVAKLKEIVESKQYGEVFQAECWIHSYLEPMPGSWFSRKEQLGGGTLFSHGCHYIDILQWLLGEPVEVAEIGTRLGTEWMEGEGTSHSIMKFASGAVAHLGISWGMQYREAPYRFQLHTPMACISLNSGTDRIDVISADGKQTVFQDTTPKGPGQSVSHEIKHFLECIANKERPSIDGCEGLRSHRIIWAMEKHQGTPIKL